MTLDRIIELQLDQLERYKALKMSCSTCIDDETIEAQILTIKILKENKELSEKYFNSIQDKNRLSSNVDCLEQEVEELKNLCEIYQKYTKVYKGTNGKYYMYIEDESVEITEHEFDKLYNAV